MKILKLAIPVVVVIVFVTACSRQHSDSGKAQTSNPATVASTNQPGKAFTTKDGFTVYLGAVKINGTNVPLTNVQVR